MGEYKSTIAVFFHPEPAIAIAQRCEPFTGKDATITILGRANSRPYTTVSLPPIEQGGFAD